MTRFHFNPTTLAGLFVVQQIAIDDHRGFLSRVYCADEFRKNAGIQRPIVQINHTLTRKIGAVRGLHFQYHPHAEVKLVSCLKGEIYDVAVDLRPTSPTFLQWHGEKISSTNRRSLLIPEGFGHGFQTLTEDCELLYLHTAAHRPEAEGAVNVADPRLNIAWPLPVTDLSERDRNHPLIDQEFRGIVS
ncbi:MAG: dTDP-4-dehydrorhamnose 3,5-epimerase [Desulfobulbaceae bacterium]|nr:dTDP-4-dehydrorhamnose 3,5-epimerase [Desulfobulbaceae bacterium]